MKNFRKFLVLIFAVVLGFALVGCEEKGPVIEGNQALEDQADKVYLGSLDEINDDLKLPKYAYGDKEYPITWTSSNSEVINIREYAPVDEMYILGYVTMQLQETTVKLTATVTNGADSTTREFTVKVLADEYIAMATVAEAKSPTDKVASTTKIKVEGTVVFTTGSGYFVSDGKDIVYVYGSNHGRTIGEKVIVRGVWATYNNMPQFASGAVAKVVGEDTTTTLESTATDMSVAEIAALKVNTVDDKNSTLAAKTTFKVVSLPANSYNKYELVDPKNPDSSIQVSKYNDSTTLAELGEIADKGKYYEGYVITYCSRGEGVWDVIYVPGTAKEVTITLTDAEKVASVRGKVEAMADQLIADNMTLFTTDAETGATVVWASDNADIIAADGTYTAPAKKTVVKLTATITVGGETATVTIEVTAKAGSAAHRNYIDEARSSHEGSNIVGVTVEGVVTNVLGNSYFIQDGDYGIEIYNHSGHGYVVGDNVSVTGTLTTYNGLYEITTVTASEKIDTKYTANPFEITDFSATALIGQDCTLVSMYDLTYKSGTMTVATNDRYTSGYNASSIIFTDASGKDVTLRTDGYMNAAEAKLLADKIAALNVGDKVSFVDMTLGWYNNPQIIPTEASQLRGENTIRTARKSYVDSNIVGTTVKGVVTNVMGNSYFIQDGYYAIEIYNHSGHEFVVGDMVSVTGTLTTYNGLYEITTVTASEKITEVYAPKAYVITEFSAEALLDKDCTLVSMYNLTYKSGTMTASTNERHTSGYSASSIIFTAVDGTEVTVRTDAYMNAEAAKELDTLILSLKAGDVVNLIGVNVGWYSNPQIQITLASQLVVNTIASARPLYSDADVVGVTVEGVVTNVMGNSYFIQDGDYGIEIYNHTGHEFVVGDSVSVTGTLTTYNGLYEIKTVTDSKKIEKEFVAQRQVILEDEYDNISLLGRDGILATMYNLTYKSGTMTVSTDAKHTSGFRGSSIIFTTANGTEVTVRTDAYMNAEAAQALNTLILSLKEGDAVNLVGVNVIWNNGPQLQITLASQLVVKTVATPEA